MCGCESKVAVVTGVGVGMDHSSDRTHEGAAGVFALVAKTLAPRVEDGGVHLAHERIKLLARQGLFRYVKL